MRLDSVRARLTLFSVATLAAALIAVSGLIYVLLARALYSRIDDNLRAVVQIATTSLANDLAEGQDYTDAARSTAAELASRQQMVAIYDPGGRLLAEGGRDDDLEINLPELGTIPTDTEMLATVGEVKDDDDRHRLVLRRVSVPPSDSRYLVVVGSELEPTDEELESLREILAYVIPTALVLAGAAGWFLARQSLAPVAIMARRAQEIGVADLTARLPVANPRDELGRLATTFNDLLNRLEASLTQQRQFMADASHELCTPVATSRTAAAVALQQRHRDEEEYRESLAIIEQQTARLSRIVDDMFTLARADAGSYPVRRTPMYLDEVVDDGVRAARVLADRKQVSIESATIDSASFTGDEELMRRLISNLLDNAVRHARKRSIVHVNLTHGPLGYVLSVTNAGEPIPPEIQEHIFERFFRGDMARTPAHGGAGLGLALARWVARAHGGDVTLVNSSPDGTTFSAVLPEQS
ncbi:MAG TPA: ATP-binding protein [Vicinamibacterales bacterium]|nr:ATP-binding protein [Vicinamibacterales bacterium]